MGLGRAGGRHDGGCARHDERLPWRYVEQPGRSREHAWVSGSARSRARCARRVLVVQASPCRDAVAALFGDAGAPAMTVDSRVRTPAAEVSGAADIADFASSFASDLTQALSAPEVPAAILGLCAAVLLGLLAAAIARTRPRSIAPITVADEKPAPRLVTMPTASTTSLAVLCVLRT